MNRSYLFVPADSEKKLMKAAASDADALIIDLEDSVAQAARPKARTRAAEFLAESIRPARLVRINPLRHDDSRRDIEAVMPAKPDGIVLPKAAGAADIVTLAESLDMAEEAHGITVGDTRILPIVTERPAALFRLHEYAGVSARIIGLTWGAEDLSAALGAFANKDEEGHWLPPYQLARSLCLFAAAAAAVAAIDTVYTDFRDLHGLAAYAGRARRDGFTGMLAIHPAQVATINNAFMPSHDEISRARRIVELFTEHEGAGVLELDGEMIDRPHFLRAQRILDVAARVDSG